MVEGLGVFLLEVMTYHLSKQIAVTLLVEMHPSSMLADGTCLSGGFGHDLFPFPVHNTKEGMQCKDTMYKRFCGGAGFGPPRLPSWI